MLCPKCGKEVADGESVCPFCNEELTAPESTEMPEEAADTATESTETEAPADVSENASGQTAESTEPEAPEEKPAAKMPEVKKSKVPLIAAIVGGIAVIAVVIALIIGGGHTAHSFGEWTVTKSPTCTEEGVEVRECECGETEAQAIAALGHSWTDANCDTAKTCADCEATEGSALGHAYTWVPNGDGTHTGSCTRDASHTVTVDCSGGDATCTDRAVCADCGSEYGTAPVHSWNGGTVTVAASCLVGGEATFECTLCAETKTETVPATGHSYSDSVITPTCTENGYTEHTCKNEGCTYSYTDDYVDAAHSWNGDRGCESGRECTKCDAVEPELGHNYTKISETEADCVTAATYTYKCDRCNDEYTDTGAEPDGHNIAGVTPVNDLISGCEYVQVYTCLDCGKPVNGDTVYNHSYVASVTAEATCVANGTKTLKCGTCGDTKTEDILKNDNAHTWDNGVLSGNIRTFTCKNTGCGATDTYVDASGSTTADVSASDLANAGGVKLENADISFDNGALGTLANKNVTVSSDTLKGEDLNAAISQLTPEQKAQIGDNEIYNFLVTENGSAISSFGGKVTVTLPYVLSDGEDVDSIAVWYMSGSTPVSIKAVYSNGFITFETDHFSYYTVTRLTPAERCALYGHSMTKTDVPVTCITDGYTLSVCVRCHKSEKTNVVAALGHNYALVTDECVTAGCTVNGKEVYSCSGCTSKYSVTVKAEGHSFSETERVDASCTAAGYVVHSCAKCDLSYKETIAQLKHVYSTSSVPATCDKYGYTLNSCDNCGYEYESDIVPATGHSYDSLMVWTDDYSSAKLVLTCGKDEAHVVEIDAAVTIKTFGGSCTTSGKAEYTAKVAYNGTNYVDVKVVESGVLAHKYSSDLVYDGQSHWNECTECGEKTSVAAHVYSDSTVTKEPNCTVEGVLTLSCACGAEKTESIPTNGVHSFANGSCTLCGAAEITCNHEELTKHEINTADFGGCGGVIVYESCACGEVKKFDEDGVDYFACDFDYNEGSEEYISDTVVKATMSATCTECGFMIDAYAFMTDAECKETVDATYNFYIGTTPILEGAKMYYEYDNHSTEMEFLPLKEYGACGGVAVVHKCTDCGNVELSEARFKCGEIVETEQTVDGIVYKTTTRSCADCALKYVESAYTVMDNVCEGTTYVTVELYVAGVLVCSDKQEGYIYEHEFDTEFEKRGDDCYDGVKVTDHCDICDTTETSYYYGHKTEYANVDLSEYTDCGGSITGYKCEICGEFDYFNDMSIYCDIEMPETPATETVDGVVHTIYRGVCPDCGLVVVNDTWEIEESLCVTTRYESYSIYFDGALIVYGVESESDYDHDYVYTTTGDNCEVGHTVTETCSKCGDTETWTTSNHAWQTVELDLSDYTACGGTVTLYKCVVCGLVRDLYAEDSGCDLSGDPEYGNYTADDGTERQYMQQTCLVCGAVLRMETWVGGDTECVRTQYRLYKMKKGDTVIFEFVSERTEIGHEFEYSYVMFGDTCEDGYKIVKVCTVCEETDKDYSFYHETIYKEVDLSELGLCPGYISVQYCKVCDNVFDYYTNYSECRWEHVSSDGSGDTYTCRECGVQRVRSSTVGERDENCTVKTTDKLVYIKDGRQIYSVEAVSSYTRHNMKYEYDFYGESCEDGVKIYGVCLDCGTDEEGVYYWHYDISRFYYDLAPYTACGGSISYSTCPCGYRSDLYNNLNCNMSYSQNTYYDDNGVRHTVTARACADCGLRHQRDYYDVTDSASCSKTTYYTLTVTIGETLIVNEAYSQASDAHDYDITIELMPDAYTCQDGVYLTFACKNCDDGYTDTVYWCYTVPVRTVDLSAYGAKCGGYLKEVTCACKEEHYVTFESVNCDFDYSEEYWNNSYDYSGFYTCGVTHPENCGFTINKIVKNEVAEGSCVGYIKETWRIGYNRQSGECAYEFTYYTDDAHSEHTYEYSCTDENYSDGSRLLIRRYDCSVCGAYKYDKYEYESVNGQLYETYQQHYESDPENPDQWTEYNEIIERKIYVNAAGQYSTYNSREYYAYSYKNGRQSIHEITRTRDYGYNSPLGEGGYTEIMTDTASDGIATTYKYIGYKSGHEYPISVRYERNSYWINREYEYDFDNCCSYTCTYTSSYGDINYEYGNDHRSTRVAVSEPTCTQFGIYVYRCLVCGTEESDGERSPYDHYWLWNREDQTYYCNRCGLENINGSSGSVVMEDFTEAYGNNTDYVIGYWARDNVDFEYYVSVVTESGEEIILDTVTVNECTNINGFSVSKQAVKNAAAAKGLEEGKYSVRFTFVPYGADGSYDYAITLE